ncbi:MAG: nicotinate (nicotinamide) nucleotide adenylyltransferase [Parachlamydiales bacterium]
MIGLLGGTFDPIHFGHLHIAQEIQARRHLKEVWFIPARLSPHKQESPPAEAEHRKRMVELAIAGYPHFQLYTGELEREGPSYTVDTVRELTGRYPKERFALLIADELVPTLPDWEGIHEILERTTLLVGQRIYGHLLPKTGEETIDRAAQAGYCEMETVDITATAIRKRIAQGGDCRSLLPPPVIDYIAQHNLYKKI